MTGAPLATAFGFSSLQAGSSYDPTDQAPASHAHEGGRGSKQRKLQAHKETYVFIVVS